MKKHTSGEVGQCYIEAELTAERIMHASTRQNLTSNAAPGKMQTRAATCTKSLKPCTHPDKHCYRFPPENYRCSPKSGTRKLRYLVRSCTASSPNAVLLMPAGTGAAVAVAYRRLRKRCDLCLRVADVSSSSIASRTQAACMHRLVVDDRTAYAIFRSCPILIRLQPLAAVHFLVEFGIGP